jgi:hypothetical protein
MATCWTFSFKCCKNTKLANMQISPLTKLYCLSYTILILICMQVPWDIYCCYKV